MNNRNKRQIKKLISGLCAAGTMYSAVDTAKTSGWSKLHWCSETIANEAADHFLGYVKKGVIPFLNEKKGLNVYPNYDSDEIDEINDIKKKITDGIDELITSMTWRKFVDETLDKYIQSLGMITDEQKYVLDALRDALKNMNGAGTFKGHSIFIATTQAPSLSDIVKRVVFNWGGAIGEYTAWREEIRWQLEYKMSGLTKALIGAGVIAATVTGGIMLSGKMRDWSQERIAKNALKAKQKHQEKEDAQAKIFADQVDIDPKKINVEKLKTRLEEEALNWPYAAAEIKLFIDTYIGILIDKQKDPLAKCPPIILIGKPGCGKTEWIKRVINCTFDCLEDPANHNSEHTISWKDKCILINQDKIDKNSSVSARDQISGTHEEKREDVSVTCYSDSAAANKFGKGMHLKYIDEIEKLMIDVILSIWDTADSGGRAVVLATGNGNPADYIQGNGADFKEAFQDRAIILEIPAPDTTYIRTSIENLISKINEENPDKAPVVVSEENMKGLVEACRSMRSVATMKSPILGLQLSQTLAGKPITPIKINPQNPKPERILIDDSYNNNDIHL